MEPRLFSRGYKIIRISHSRCTECFNGATAFQPWIYRGRPEQGCPHPPASMEPRLFSRGYPVKHGSRLTLTPCFNGATAFQPWIFKRTSSPGPHWNASIEPRLFSRGYTPAAKPIAQATVASIEPRLFSRGYEVQRYTAGLTSLASIEPRLFSRGYTVDNTSHTLQHGCFNRATAFQPWIPELPSER